MTAIVVIFLLVTFLIEMVVLLSVKAAHWKRCLAATALSWILPGILITVALKWSAHNAELLAWGLLTGIPVLLGLAVLALALVLRVVSMVILLRSERGLWAAPLSVITALVLPGMVLMAVPRTPTLEDAVKRQDLVAVQKLAEQQADGLQSAALLAAHWRKPEVLRWALSQGAPVDARDATGSLFVHIARGTQEPVDLATQQQMVGMLLDRGARLDTVVADLVGDAPLPILQQLLDKKAPLNDAKGVCSAYFNLAYSKRTDVTEVVKLLVARGGNLEGRKTYDKQPPQSPLCNAIMRDAERLACLYLESGATADPVLLVEAAGRGQLETVKALLDKKVDPNQADEQGLTAWRVSGDPALRALLEKHGAKPSSPRVELTQDKSGHSTQTLFENLYAHNTSLDYVQSAVAGQLPGRPPFDLLMRFGDEPEHLYPHVMCMRMALLQGSRKEVAWGKWIASGELTHEERILNWAGKPYLKLEWLYRAPK